MQCTVRPRVIIEDVSSVRFAIEHQTVQSTAMLQIRMFIADVTINSKYLFIILYIQLSINCLSFLHIVWPRVLINQLLLIVIIEIVIGSYLLHFMPVYLYILYQSLFVSVSVSLSLSLSLFPSVPLLHTLGCLCK